MSGKASDHGGYGRYEDDESDKPRLKRDKHGLMRRDDHKYEFDCPECSANNPWGDGFGDGGEVQCHYCGVDFKVFFLDGGKLKFRMI